jgi:hypothetical protein
MPSINDAISAHQNLIAAGKGTPVPTPEALVSPSPMPLPIGTGGILGPVRGSLQPTQVLATDFQKQNTVGANMRSPIFPIQASSVTTVKNTTTVAEAGGSSSASSLIIEVNGNKTPLQTLLNLVQGAGIQLSVNNNGGVNIVNTGTTVWTPNQVTWLEDFTSNAGAPTDLGAIFDTNAFGQQGWYLNGDTTNNSSGVVNGGAPPFTGYVWWANLGTASVSSRLYPAWFFANEGTSSAPGNESTDWNTNALSLFDYPGWQVSFIFRLMKPMISSGFSTAFSTTQKAIYVGLFGGNPAFYNGSNNTSRPDKFFGVRFDTSTTSPPINDSFLT